MKTVKELENQLKISKVSIYSMIKRPEFKQHIFKNDKGITLIDEIGEQLLTMHYSKAQGETINDIISDELTSNVLTDNTAFKNENIDITDESDSNTQSSKDDFHSFNKVESIDIIQILQNQLKVKDNQINNLLDIISNQQKLQGAKLLTKNEIPKATENNNGKKSIWNIFSKKS